MSQRNEAFNAGAAGSQKGNPDRLAQGKADAGQHSHLTVSLVEFSALLCCSWRGYVAHSIGPWTFAIGPAAHCIGGSSV